MPHQPSKPRKPAARAAAPPARSRRTVVGAAALAVVGGAGVLVAVISGGGDDTPPGPPPVAALPGAVVHAGDAPVDRPGAPVVATGGELALGPDVDGFHITYRVDTDVATTETIWVWRPFEARQEARPGEPPGGEIQSVQIDVLGDLALLRPATDPLVLAVPPGPGGPDLRPRAVLADLLARRAVDRREIREVEDRRCQVYRFGSTITGGVLATNDPTTGEWADVCIDEDGLVLEEIWVIDSKVVRRRLAVAVIVNPPRDPKLLAYDPNARVTPELGGGSVRKVAAGTRPGGEWWEAPAPPDGFTYLGRYAVVPAQLRSPSSGTIGDTNATIADVWTSGPDLVVVDQTVDEAPASRELADAEPVDLGDLGAGAAARSMRLSEVRAVTPGGRLLRVYGTVRLDTLIELARSLERVDGGATGQGSDR